MKARGGFFGVLDYCNFQMYIDGQLTDTNNGVPSTFSPATIKKLVVGKDYFEDDSRFLQATLDELKIYETILTVEEIMAGRY